MQATQIRAPGYQLAYVDGMKAVDVFFGRDGVENFLGVHLRWQGHLHQNAVDIILAVEIVDEREQFAGGDRGGRGEQEAAQS